ARVPGVARPDRRGGVEGARAREPSPGLLRPREGGERAVGRRDPGGRGDSGADPVASPRRVATGWPDREPQGRAVHLLFGAARTGQRLGAPVDRVLLAWRKK